MTAAFAIILGMIVLIPVLAILIDSPLSEALARRIASRDSEPANARLDALEKEMQYLTQAVESLQDESEFVRSLVEGRDEHALPPPSSTESGSLHPEGDS
ncbi:MAG: hypothetical protein OEU54_11255 [Gemmatimonadota bacterium]|nr:hypothetical protein [Gemmatimonadota bacterium]